jgi:hypothetical protein
MRDKAYRRWKTFSKYVTRIKKRLSWMRVQYGETTVAIGDGAKVKRALWRSPKDWKEADANKSTGAKTLKDTPTTDDWAWKDVEHKREIKKMRRESKDIINEELNELDKDLKE